MKKVLKNAMKNSAENIIGWLGSGYCRRCGIRVTVMRMSEGGDVKMCHSPATEETRALAESRGCTWWPELAEGGAAIWNEQ